MTDIVNELKEHTKELIDKAQKSYQRRMIVVLGKNAKEYATAIVNEALSYLKKILKRDPRVWFFSDDPEWSIGPITPMKEAIKALGTTADLMLLDLRGGFFPNDLGRLGGVVQGGGLYVIVGDHPNEWRLTKYHKKILAYPYRLEDMDNYFMERFIRKLYEHDGITIIVDGEIVKRDTSVGKKRKLGNIEIPKNTERTFNKKFYKKCLTQDQVDALNTLERLFKDESRIQIMIADRGRGKSSVLGIFLAAYMHHSKRKIKVILTAPHPENVMEVFRFAQEMLEAHGHKVKTTKNSEGLIVNLECSKGSISYYKPLQASSRKGDIFIVDEAASLQVPMLLKILKKAPKVVYSSTIHGYEGAGRGFSIRFMGSLKEKGLKFDLIEMHEPIRYAKDDPIERFLFDVLLLDAEPEDVEVQDLDKLELYMPSKYEFVKDEKLLREYFSIFVLAHYRNNPNDLALLLDTPNHYPVMLLYEGKVVCSMQISIEGDALEIADDMLRGEKINGHMIPDRMVKYYRYKEFAKFKGIRVVRIAVHPNNMNRGIGSRALKMIEERFKDKVDWIGSGFGATHRLLNFWVKNGYKPIHMAPIRNEVSGEYSVIVIKPLKSYVREYVETACNEFVIRVFESLEDTYRDLEIPIVRLLARVHTLKWRARFTPKQKERAWAYAFGPLTYEVARDIARELTLTYFLDSDRRVELTGREEKILIMRVLQCWPISDIAKYFRLSPTTILIELKDIMKKLVSTYEEVKV
ncbi:MAG: tRNA(Met) cytidine acetyltransferase [Euryarchaeota archaeon]|nr:tRNA(Met) cytidine acetyltransferase [Euryarchaeota archaeon]